MSRAMLLTSLTLIAACEPGDPVSDVAVPAPDLCSLSLTTAQVQGQWFITGTGERTGCDNDFLDTESFVFEGTVAITQKADNSLTLNPLTPAAGVTFEMIVGQVRGTCIDAQFLERDSRDAVPVTIKTTFVDAEAVGKTITGKFQQEGPGPCEATGTFLARIQ